MAHVRCSRFGELTRWWDEIKPRRQADRKRALCGRLCEMQKPQLRPILFAVIWGNPYTHPPEGMPRELIAVTRMQESTRDIPPEILQALETVAQPGSGWSL